MKDDPEPRFYECRHGQCCSDESGCWYLPNVAMQQPPCGNNRWGVLCAYCNANYSDFQGDCVWCNDDNMSPTVWTFGYFFLFVLIMALLLIRPSESALVHITVFFIQNVPLIVSQENHMVSWLEIFNIDFFGPVYTASGWCAQQMTAFDVVIYRWLLAMSMWLVLLFIWAGAAVLKTLLGCCKCNDFLNNLSASSFGSRSLNLVILHAGFNIYLFSFSTLTRAGLELFSCRVVWTLRLLDAIFCSDMLFVSVFVALRSQLLSMIH